MFEKILRLCKERNITVTALERILGFGRCTITRWKECSPSVDKLKKVADYFGVSIDYFVDDATDEKGA